MSNFTPTAFVAEARRILDSLDQHTIGTEDARLGRDLDETAGLIQALEAMLPHIQPPPSPQWCNAAREVIESLFALRAEIIQSSPQTRSVRCLPLAGGVAEAIRACETVAWSLPRDGRLPADVEPRDPIPLAWLRIQVPQQKVRGDPSKLALWLERRNVRVFKIAGKNHAERTELLDVFIARSKVYDLIKEYRDDAN